jgi:NAD(P) transhydrogenase subunit alpha
MTAAGTVKPARVIVMGAGVAGLQALATAKRLGAVVEVSDVRPAVKEQVESLGGRFIDLPSVEGEGKGGYAKEMTPEFLSKQREIVAERARGADVVITTALVPGKPAPKLVTAEMVRSMRPGSVIVDLAVAQGGNCELSVKDEDVVERGVRIIGRSNYPATMPGDASTLYARNVLALLEVVVKKGAIALDVADEIVAAALVTHEGAKR